MNELTETHVWFALAVGAVFFLVMIVIGITVYSTAVDTAAIAKGLCQATVPGQTSIVWTTCPR